MLLFLVVANISSAQTPTCVDIEKGVPVTVAEVIAGDIFKQTDGTIVRLAGIQIPSRPLTVSDDASWPWEDRARRAFASLVGRGSVRILPAAEAPDRHGRIAAWLLRADQTLVQSALVAQGLARVRWQPEESGCFQVLVAQEDAARTAAIGLWSDPEYAVKSADDPSLRSRNGLYELVEGRVVSVGHGTQMVFLDFGQNFRSDFTVMVPGSVAERLATAGVSLDGLAGKRLRVRGVIEEAGGPAIRLNDPAEMDIIE